MIKIKSFLGITLAFGMLISNLSQSVFAQESTPPTQEKPSATSDGIWFNSETGLWMSLNDELQIGSVGLDTVGGPDDFGYTWDNSVPLSWIDATDGTVTTMSGSSYGLHTGPIALPFAFKYYGETYASVFIAGSGYISFIEGDVWPWQPRLPSPSLPNTIVAPYAAPLTLASTGFVNRVYYKSGGSEPNRYFVAEWYQVKEGDETFTFEVILLENGNIIFQYQQMTYAGSFACGSIGIEDASGLDGLIYGGFCNWAPSNKAIQFYMPPPSANISIKPLHQGGFTQAGGESNFTITISNNGELGDDTYDFATYTTWPVSFKSNESGNSLSDTDGDGWIDTGSVVMDSSVSVLVTIQTPTLANVGDYNTVLIAIISSLNPSKVKSATIRTAIPAPFAQVFMDNADGAFSLDLVQPDLEIINKVTPDFYLPYDIAVAEKLDGFINLWRSSNYNGDNYYDDLEYVLANKSGNIIRAVTKLTNNEHSEYNTYQSSPAVAIAPNGRIGLTWSNTLQDKVTYQFQNNIIFSVLDSNGNFLVNPTSLTNNAAWGSSGDLNIPYFSSPKITASGDNHFTITWDRQHGETSGWVNDIFYTVRNSDGSIVKNLVQMTNDTAGWDRYYQNPSITNLTNNRVALAWNQNENYNYQAVYSILDSEGNLLVSPIGLGMDLANLDMVQLSSGNILIAGGYWGMTPQIVFAILDGSNYNRITGLIPLLNSYAITGDCCVSVTADKDGQGILTWMDADYYSHLNLYYALVDSVGNVVTPPMIFKTSKAINSVIQTSFEGFGNTTLTPVYMVYLPVITK